MTSQKLFSVGLVSVLVVLSSITGVAFTTGLGANADVSSASTADTANALAQQAGGETEPNDDRANATPISTGEEITGEAGTRENGSDADWYAFDVSAGEAFNVNYGGMTDNVSVYGPSGEQLDTEEVSTPDTFVVGAVADEAGTYYVRITGGIYDFDVQTSPPDSFEPNDDRESAASIDAGNTVNATLFEGEHDWYAVEVDDGGTLSAVVERLNGLYDPAQNVRIDLFAPDGSPVGEGFTPEDTVSSAPLNQTDVSGGGESRRQVGQRVTADQNGTYYVRISPVEGLSGFVEYSLTTDVTGADQPTTDEPTTETTTEETTTEEPTTEDTTTETETPQPPTDTTQATTDEQATEEPTTEETADETTTEDPGESTQSDTSDTAYYQVDLVTGEPIENLRGPNGTYSNDELVRFAHGSTDEPITRRSEGEFTTNESLADRIESQDITVENGTAQTTFTVAEGDSVTLTLASYQKVGPGWSPQTEAQQEFVDSETRTFKSGTHTFTVDLPGDTDDSSDA